MQHENFKLQLAGSIVHLGLRNFERLELKIYVSLN